MNQSFYTAAVGAGGYKARLDVISNNIANVNTVGYKLKSPQFTDLIYQNIHAEGAVDGEVKNGVGGRLEKTDTLFRQGSVEDTGRNLDFSIVGEGFFAVYDPYLNRTTYTRDGAFSMSEQDDGRFILTDGNGRQVLDKNNLAIEILSDKDELEERIGIFTFNIKDGLINIGENEFMPGAKNGPPQSVENTEERLMRGTLEMSNVEIAGEIAKVIESQRAMQYAIRMVQTSDEIANTINTLR